MPAIAMCRTVRFQSFDELLADAERAVRENAGTSGNWSLGQILEHLAIGIERSIDGTGIRSPFLLRTLGPIIKHWILARGMKPGIRLSPEAARILEPPETDAQVALEHLRRAVQRAKTETARAPHFVFGRTNAEEMNRIQLRHAELHMGFVRGLQ